MVERGAEVSKFEVPMNDKSRSVPIKITLQGARGTEVSYVTLRYVTLRGTVLVLVHVWVG